MATKTDAETDRLVAEMMWPVYTTAPAGIRWHDTGDERIKIGVGESRTVQTWSPTTNPSHDYEVLCYVREHWEGESRRDFVQELISLHVLRPPRDDPFPMMRAAAYLVGDYARAALAAQPEGATP